MLHLPKLKRDTKGTENLCKCRPVCKSRRRLWKGEIQNTSAELLLERKPPPLCFKRWPSKIYPNGPCPLFGRTRRVTQNERYTIHKPKVVRICQAALDVDVETPYLHYANLARDIGALGAVPARTCGTCTFCACGACCPCGVRDYILHDEERAARRRSDMRTFDARVKTDHLIKRVMYDLL